jgi:hypothetical protein
LSKFSQPKRLGADNFLFAARHLEIAQITHQVNVAVKDLLGGFDQFATQRVQDIALERCD